MRSEKRKLKNTQNPSDAVKTTMENVQCPAVLSEQNATKWHMRDFFCPLFLLCVSVCLSAPNLCVCVCAYACKGGGVYYLIETSDDDGPLKCVTLAIASL